MVSPSKAQQKSHQHQVSHRKNLGKHLRIQRGPKPLEKKSFYLDIKNHSLSQKLENKIKELGGTIELFLIKSVELVISDKEDSKLIPLTAGGVQQQRKWGYASGGSGGGPPSLRSTEAPTPPTPYCSVEGPLSNYSTHSSKGQNILRPKSRVDAMLERALTQPLQCTLDPLDNALKWGIPVWSTHELVVWLDKITASLKETHNIRKDNKDIKVKLLREPFIKLESYQNDTRPVFAELKVWPMINFNSEPGTCPFENKIENSDNKKLQKKVTKENNTTVKRDKDMTRKPRVNVKTRKSENTGYCEICRVDFRSRTKHLQSSQHQNFIRNDNNFLSLDKLINTGANIEAFLMKNKTIDDSDCKVFANGAHKNIENGILLSDEKERKSSLNILKVEEENNKMVQCNGARRNLDLSLDSSHNLRTRQKPESGHLLRSKGRPFSDEEKNNKYLLEDKVIVKKSKGTYWVETDSEEDEEEDLVCEIKQKVTVNGNANVICADYKDNENLKPKINGYNSQEEKYDIENKIKIQETIQNENENSKVESIQPAKVHRYDGCKNRTSKKGKKMFKGRQRLSVEERLIEDNKQYYKVEVLNNKLRSSTFPTNNMLISAAKEASVNEKIKDEEVSSDKPVKLCFKRVRKSELSLLSNEAESFMFGEPKRDDDSSSEESENSDNNTSILPKDTESDNDKNANSMEISSSPNVSPNKQTDEDLQDSNLLGRMKKKRLSQNEALIKDNVDYYKFETPGSRLRYQAPLTGISETEIEKEQSNNQINVKSEEEANLCTKPLAQVEKMHFSFEAVPTSEPWYQTYQRQDEGAEFWHYFSEIDNSKPFLLPYEIENFHEILYKKIQRNENRRGRGRGRGGAFNIGRSPRKSPRCHASTLAIMSTILKKNPNYQTKELSTIHEEARAKSHIDTKSVLKRSSQKSDVDEDLKELVKNIDKMFDSESDVPDDLVYSHVDFLQTSESSEIEASEVVLPKGAPPDLLELMDKCPENVPTNIENSSYASSECGDLSSELPLKKRKIKKRTNKTGWPGNKLRKKVLIKQAESQEDVINCGRNENSLLSNEFNDSENDNKTKTTNSGKENETMNIIASSSRRSKIKKCKEKVLDTSKSSNRRSKSWNKSKSQEESTECESDGEASEISQESTHTTPKHKNNSFKRKSLNKKVTPKSSIRLQRSSTFKRRVCCSTPKKQRPNSSSSPTKKHLSESSLSFSSPSHRNFIRRKHKLKGQTSFNSKSEKCKKDLFLKNARSQKKLKRIRKSNSASSDSHNGECSSSGQTSTTKTRDHRRSSMDNLQPIIRLPKIDGQVDLDNSSTVLRKLKSSSPTKSGQPPKKKFKSGPNNKRHSQNKSYSTKNS